MHKIIYTIIISIFLGASTCFAAAPKVYFSDLTDGVTSGWNGSQTKGAAVSIWGNNFGSSRGASYVTVGGVNLTSASDYAEWAATTNPTTARGLQRITFWLNSNMSLGDTTISVTTANGTSQAIPFYTRNTGKIYFVSPSGNDNNTGLNDSDQMWATFSKVRKTLSAGDVVYFRNGLWTKAEVGGGSADAILKLQDMHTFPEYGFNDGTEHNSVTLVSYPGEVALIGRGLESDADVFVKRYDASGYNGLHFWTFAKFKVNIYDCAFCYNSSADLNHDESLRIIGNDMTTSNTTNHEGTLMSLFSSHTGLKILGNNMHGVGKVNDNDPHGISKAKAIYFPGGGVSDNVEVGWNEIYRCNGHTQFFGHYRSDHLDNLKFHDNYIHDEGKQILVLGGGDPGEDPQYHFLGTGIKVYNNIFANNLGHIRFSNGSNGLGGYFEVYNNTFYNNTQDAGHSELILTQFEDSFNFSNNIVVMGPDSICHNYWGNNPAGYDDAEHSNNATGTNNLWFGGTSKPAWSNNDIDNQNPQFVSASDYHLQTTSPAKNAGVTIGSFNTDYDGVSRPQGASWDIGAYEFEDTAGPSRTNTTASSQPAGTNPTSMTLTTGVNATCRYSTTSGVSYDSMTDTFTTTGATSHSQDIATADGQSYTYYVRCTDGTTPNDSDLAISWSVESAASCDSSHLNLCADQATCEAATGHWCGGVCQASTCEQTTVNCGSMPPMH